MEDITKEEFLAYKDVQESAIFNMAKFELVSAAAGLSVKKCRAIMNNYSKLYKKYIIDGES